MSRMQILTATALAASLMVPAAFAQRQQEPGQRLNGTIERVAGNFIFATGRDGSPSRSSSLTTPPSRPC
jgi:hypothetical protein